MKSNIEKHEKAIRLLEAIDRLDYRIWSNSKTVKDFECKTDWNNVVSYYGKRVEIDTKIKERLTNYYNQKFKL